MWCLSLHPYFYYFFGEVQWGKITHFYCCVFLYAQILLLNNFNFFVRGGGGSGKEGMQSCNNAYYTVVVSFCTPKFFSQTSFWGRKGGMLQSCNTSIFLWGGIWGWGGLSHVSCTYVTQCSQCILFYCCYFCSCNFSHFGSKFCNFWIDDYKGKVQNIFFNWKQSLFYRGYCKI